MTSRQAAWRTLAILMITRLLVNVRIREQTAKRWKPIIACCRLFSSIAAAAIQISAFWQAPRRGSDGTDMIASAVDVREAVVNEVFSNATFCQNPR